MRLPSLIAGTATIPLVYLLGVRTLGRTAGLIAAAVIALSPFMIYYSVEARAYALMIALLTRLDAGASAGDRERPHPLVGRLRGLLVRGAATRTTRACSSSPRRSCGWSGSTARRCGRCIARQRRRSRSASRPGCPGFIADNDSPTTDILDLLQPFDFDAVTDAIENWAVGYPYIPDSVLPGNRRAD